MRYREGEVIAQRYQVINPVGTGSGGEVYKVWDKKRSTHLALKLLRPEWNSNPRLVANFIDEAKSLSNLQHPNIVRFYELVDYDDSAFFLMDYVEGVTLREILQGSTAPLPLNQILSIMTPLCKALHYAHQQNVIHCDVKPENIMMDQNGQVYLTDFGIAFTRGQEDNFLGKAGTPAYMAPEQIQGLGVLPQTDIYALGIILYEMFTGVKPFRGNSVSGEQPLNEGIRWEQVHTLPIPPIHINPMVGKLANDVILTCLNKNALLRYSDAIEFMHALEKTQIESTPINEEVKVQLEDADIHIPVRKKNVVPIFAIITAVTVISLVLAMGQSGENLPARTIIQPVTYDYQNACMEINIPLQDDAVLEECVTSVTVSNDGKIRINFRWELVSGSPNLGVNIPPDTNNHNMYILDDLGNRWDHISTGGGANQSVTLFIGDKKEGWFLFPSLPTESSGFYFVDEDNQGTTKLLERKW